MEKLFLGIDLGGTNTKIGVGPLHGALKVSGSVETQVEKGPEAWVARVVEAVKDWNLDFDSVGVGSPGPLDTLTGKILSTPNLQQFKDFAMKPVFEAAFKKKCSFENDANCAALGEFGFGAHKNNPNLVVLTLGTGVGSGVIAGGQLVRGAKGFATEMGHMVINFNGPLCKC
jgi:glucokinase